jgi:flagellar basal body rod protein FlgG
MNVGLYSGAAGMKVGEDYQQLLSENLSLQSVPGYKRTLPVFSTDVQTPSGTQQSTTSGNPASVRMTRIVDFSQGPIQPSGSPYHVAIEGKGFFEVKEADGTTSYTRNGSFSLSTKGLLHTSDGASVLGRSGTPITIGASTGGDVTIGTDGTISQGGETVGKLGTAHFDNPTAALQPGAFGRFTAAKSDDAKQGLAPTDQVMQNSLEESNGNPVEQMADMIQAMRLYEANSKSMKAVDDTQNQMITSLGARPQG